MHPEWTEARRKAIRRNRAIQGHNRFLKEHGEWLGLEWKEMELVPVPAVEKTMTKEHFAEYLRTCHGYSAEP